MTRPLSPEKEHEFAKLSAFLDMYATHFMKSDPSSPSHPTNSLSRISAAVGKSKALVGLRQAINDSLEGLRDLTPEHVTQLDATLRAAGIITLAELRRRYSRQYKALFRRGTLRNETEYYLAKGVLCDCGETLEPAEAEQLGAMLLAFEQAANNSFKPNPLRSFKTPSGFSGGSA